MEEKRRASDSEVRKRGERPDKLFPAQSIQPNNPFPPFLRRPFPSSEVRKREEEEELV